MSSPNGFVSDMIWLGARCVRGGLLIRQWVVPANRLVPAMGKPLVHQPEARRLRFFETRSRTM
jgi:hypothetical protein